MNKLTQRILRSRLALALGATVVALVLAEIALRVFTDLPEKTIRIGDKKIGKKLRPGAKGVWTKEGHGHYRINSLGFRDREWALEKSPGTYRIAFLGDSFIEALQVDLEDTLPKQLEKLMPDVETLNFGVAGHSTVLELLTYRHIARRYHPDLVVLGFFGGNDLFENYKALYSAQTTARFRRNEQGNLVIYNHVSMKYRIRSVVVRITRRCALAQLVFRSVQTLRAKKIMRRLEDKGMLEGTRGKPGHRRCQASVVTDGRRTALPV